MKKWVLILLFVFSQNIFALSLQNYLLPEDWGFYAHKLLNRLAIFTLPEGMIDFYKSNLNYIQEHAVDPDKRRYAIKGEAIRHFIDIDQWGPHALSTLPRNYEEAIIQNSAFYYIEGLDTTLIFDTTKNSLNTLQLSEAYKTKYTVFKSNLSTENVRLWMHEYSLKYFDEKNWWIPGDKIKILDSEIFHRQGIMWIDDHFSMHGILPYSLPQFYYRLVNAFKERNADKIIKLSAEIGHYVGDAHVPLHTTKNYNGQLTNQDGIHAFWESRIPELFAESEFDFVVGNSEYISDISKFVWNAISESHAGVDSVLLIEKRISESIPSDQQYCFENRIGVVTKLPCKDYAALYNKSLDYQVEDRFRKCILAIGSFWRSAWTDAGQPDLKNLVPLNNYEEFSKEDSITYSKQRYDIRSHE